MVSNSYSKPKAKQKWAEKETRTDLQIMLAKLLEKQDVTNLLLAITTMILMGLFIRMLFV